MAANPYREERHVNVPVRHYRTKNLVAEQGCHNYAVEQYHVTLPNSPPLDRSRSRSSQSRAEIWRSNFKDNDSGETSQTNTPYRFID